MTTAMTAASHNPTPTVAEVERLLRRYPDCQPSDLDKIIWFLRHGPTLDNALLASDPDLKNRIEMFRCDHPAKFAMTGRAVAVLVAVAFGVLIFGFAVWNHVII